MTDEVNMTILDAFRTWSFGIATPQREIRILRAAHIEGIDYVRLLRT